MEYIDKTKLEKEGEAIIQSFLKRLKENGQKYPKDLYEAFKSDKDEVGNNSRKKLIRILLKEQKNRCCYCMKTLDTKNDEITLEHIIINNITGPSEYTKYLIRDTILTNKVCLASTFIDNEKELVPPYPHTIAYQNLAASCNGNILHIKGNSLTHSCCNLKRGNEYIEPIILYTTIKKEIEYKTNGFAIWIQEKGTIPTLNILGLNDDTLRMIRRIWIYAKTINFDILTANDPDKNKLLYRLLENIPDNESNILFNFTNATFWALLKKYDYFGDCPNIKE
jgi:hypothetical protein